MDRVVTVKPGVEFTVIAPGGFRILEAVSATARKVGLDLRVTSGTDGDHSGPTDPHKEGKAYDVGSKEHTPENKNIILASLISELGTDKFYVFLESPGLDKEHFHAQVKKGVSYP